MATSSVFGHRLRWVVIFSLLPCFCFSIILLGTRTFESLRPGLLFHFASAFICAALLLVQHHDRNLEGGPIEPETFDKHPFVVLTVDAILAVLFWLSLVQAYINIPLEGRQALLFSCSTFPVVICLFIHTYLSILSLGDLFCRGLALLNSESKATCGCICQCSQQPNSQEGLYGRRCDEPSAPDNSISQEYEWDLKKGVMLVV